MLVLSLDMFNYLYYYYEFTSTLLKLVLFLLISIPPVLLLVSLNYANYVNVAFLLVIDPPSTPILPMIFAVDM